MWLCILSASEAHDADHGKPSVRQLRVLGLAHVGWCLVLSKEKEEGVMSARAGNASTLSVIFLTECSTHLLVIWDQVQRIVALRARFRVVRLGVFGDCLHAEDGKNDLSFSRLERTRGRSKCWRDSGTREVSGACKLNAVGEVHHVCEEDAIEIIQYKEN